MIPTFGEHILYIFAEFSLGFIIRFCYAIVYTRHFFLKIRSFQSLVFQYLLYYFSKIIRSFEIQAFNSLFEKFVFSTLSSLKVISLIESNRNKIEVECLYLTSCYYNNSPTYSVQDPFLFFLGTIFQNHLKNLSHIFAGLCSLWA